MVLHADARFSSKKTARLRPLAWDFLHTAARSVADTRRTGRSDLRKSNACSQIRLEVHAARASVHPAQPDRRSYTRDISLSVPSQFPSQNSNASATTARRVPPPQSSCSSSAGPGAAQTLGAGRQHREACTGRDISASLLLGRVHTHQHHHSPHTPPCHPDAHDVMWHMLTSPCSSLACRVRRSNKS